MSGSQQAKQERKPSAKGEARRRWRSFMENGSVGRLRSEGRLMACYVFYWADFEKCTIRFSLRGAARSLGVRLTTVQRGVQQLVDGGILALSEKGDGSDFSLFELREVTTVCGHPDHGVWSGRPQGVVTPTTGCGQSDHEPWSARPQGVVSATTSRGHITRIPTGIPIDTSGEFNFSEQPGAGGSGPPALAEAKEGNS